MFSEKYPFSAALTLILPPKLPDGGSVIWRDYKPPVMTTIDVFPKIFFIMLNIVVQARWTRVGGTGLY